MGRHSLSYEDKELICTGQCLTDNHMNFIQGLIQKQFPTIAGLTNTLMMAKAYTCTALQSEGLQVHWIVVSTIAVPLILQTFMILLTEALMMLPSLLWFICRESLKKFFVSTWATAGGRTGLLDLCSHNLDITGSWTQWTI